MRPLLRAAPFLLLALLCLSCRGRADFYRGQESYREGEFREAYFHFWEAYRQKSDPQYLAALRVSGQQVAVIEHAEGRRAEAMGDLTRALEKFSLACEYDPEGLPLAEDYWRVWSTFEELEALEKRLLYFQSGNDAERAQEEGWPEVETVRRILTLVAIPEAREEDLRAALRRSAERRIRALRRATFQKPLTCESGELARLGGRWLRVASEMEGLVFEEENGLFSGDIHARQIAAFGAARDVLRPYLDEAEAGYRAVKRATRGLKHYGRGGALEVQGDLRGASEAYSLASLDHPFLEEARAGRVRALHRLGRELHHAARDAAGKGDWSLASRKLQSVIHLNPDDREARELLPKVLHNLSDRHVLDAGRLEALRFLGNALVRYYLALELEPQDPEVLGNIRRLEGALAERLHRSFRVRRLAVSEGERRARRDLWCVGEEVLGRVHRDLTDSTQRKLDAFLAGAQHLKPHGPSSHGGPEAAILLIEDVDFFYPQGGPSHGVETSRYVESFQLAENEDRLDAEKGLEEAREELEMAVERERSASRHKKPLASELLLLARLGLEQAERRLASLSPVVPVLTWGIVTYPTRQMRVEVELAARYRCEGETRWVTTALEVFDRVVEGNLGRNIPSDPQELPSRAEVLRLLAPRLGILIAADARSRILGRQEKLYRQALEHLRAGNEEVAVERLVAFLYTQRGEDAPSVRDAARRVKELTGCDLPAAWRSRGW